MGDTRAQGASDRKDPSNLDVLGTEKQLTMGVMPRDTGWNIIFPLNPLRLSPQD